MNNFNIVEPIIRDIKKLANGLLMPHSPLDRIIILCNRLLALKNIADWEKAVKEMHLAFDNAQEYMSKLKRLLSDISNDR